MYYKITDENYHTKDNTVWEIGKSKKKKDKQNPRLCSDDVFHCYDDLNLGLLLDPLHANYTENGQNFKILACKGKAVIKEWDKIGCCQLHIIKEIEIPHFWIKNKYKVLFTFAILCAEAVIRYNKKEDDSRIKKVLAIAKNANNYNKYEFIEETIELSKEIEADADPGELALGYSIARRIAIQCKILQQIAKLETIASKDSRLIAAEKTRFEFITAYLAYDVKILLKGEVNLKKLAYKAARRWW